MLSRPAFRVVGVRADGSELVISQDVAIDGAQPTVKLLRYGTTFKQVRIKQDDADGGLPRVIQPPKS